MAKSARGLFKATGKEPKVEIERQEHDFYETPYEATLAILNAEKDRLRSLPALWEPAAGRGAIAKEIEAFGMKCLTSDIKDYGCGATIRSFYQFGAPLAPGILTNPPFSEVSWGHGKSPWLKHALVNLRIDYMALLLPWNFPGAGGLRTFWSEHPPARCYLMRWRIDFTNQGAPPTLHGWFVWDRWHYGETVLRMLDKADPNQSAMF